jgi:hypothetical protein
MGYIQSNVTNDLVVVDRTPAAMRATLRPNEMTGSYRTSLVSSTITFSGITAANGVLFTFKNTGTGLCLIRSVQIGLQIIATGFTTTGGSRFSLYRVPTAFTQGTTGGTGYGAGQSNTVVGKKRTSMGTTAASMVIYASGAGITGDTASTEDTTPLSSVTLGTTAATVTTLPSAGLRDFFQSHTPAYNAPDMGFMVGYPLALAQNEGFRIKNDLAFINGTTGAGTAALVVSVEWDEATAY